MSLALPLLQAVLAPLMVMATPGPATSPNPELERRLEERLQTCVAGVEQAPDAVYERAMAWAAEAYHPYAVQCAAVALIELGRTEEAADRLASLAASSAGGTPEARVAMLVQAGNAYMLARLPAKAKTALDRALGLIAKDDPARPDVLIDRARAFAMLNQWRQAEEDLNAALDLRSGDGLALRLRAAARMRQGAFELAVKDAEAAVALEPKNIDALLVRGQALEALRTGQAPE
jgi:tetratricopeptide (TPR) repeat protein